MIEVFIGILAFFFCLLYDILSMRRKKYAVLFFAFGGFLLAAATGSLLLRAPWPGIFSAHPLASALSIAAALFCLALLVKVLFFPSPTEDAYLAGGVSPAVTTGQYALCRHPGVLWFAGFYLALFALTRTPQMLWAFLLFTAADVLYVVLQDRYIFPKTLSGYEDYQKTTPFLIPTPTSLRAMLRKQH